MINEQFYTNFDNCQIFQFPYPNMNFNIYYKSFYNIKGMRNSYGREILKTRKPVYTCTAVNILQLQIHACMVDCF